MRLPTILVIPFIEYQAAFRLVCSFLLHHMVEMATKVGGTNSVNDVFSGNIEHRLPTDASKAPKKKRVASNPLKFFATAIKLKTIPQHKTIPAANFPVGSFTKKYATTG